ncbi:hypothetical protein H696_05022 [Fonticula alba]|uniref:Homeobox domain-containing protein n=1 Tax=Fonticula alba TaxID=691883 RepID=A0A058Z3L7_FONAL|nr:hypothetical protein H696_05022 [Fonticula alba]KCV68736.1 hypothetical protein H696_05022 [Fonticula alba]|eukprot:XP_009497168.1 hypothetical protein H696_05022 [Fonticula alba]
MSAPGQSSYGWGYLPPADHQSHHLHHHHHHHPHNAYSPINADMDSHSSTYSPALSSRDGHSLMSPAAEPYARLPNDDPHEGSRMFQSPAPASQPGDPTDANDEWDKLAGMLDGVTALDTDRLALGVVSSPRHTTLGLEHLPLPAAAAVNASAPGGPHAPLHNPGTSAPQNRVNPMDLTPGYYSTSGPSSETSSAPSPKNDPPAVGPGHHAAIPALPHPHDRANLAYAPVHYPGKAPASMAGHATQAHVPHAGSQYAGPPGARPFADDKDRMAMSATGDMDISVGMQSFGASTQGHMKGDFSSHFAMANVYQARGPHPATGLEGAELGIAQVSPVAGFAPSDGTLKPVGSYYPGPGNQGMTSGVAAAAAAWRPPGNMAPSVMGTIPGPRPPGTLPSSADADPPALDPASHTNALVFQLESWLDPAIDCPPPDMQQAHALWLGITANRRGKANDLLGGLDREETLTPRMRARRGRVLGHLLRLRQNYLRDSKSFRRKIALNCAMELMHQSDPAVQNDTRKKWYTRYHVIKAKLQRQGVRYIAHLARTQRGALGVDQQPSGEDSPSPKVSDSDDAPGAGAGARPAGDLPPTPESTGSGGGHASGAADPSTAAIKREPSASEAPLSPDSPQREGSEPAGRSGSTTAKRFPPETVSALRETYNRTPYPEEREKKRLSRQCNLTMRQINHWFTNKRMRDKRRDRMGTIRSELDGDSLLEASYLNPGEESIIDPDATYSSYMGAMARMIRRPSMMHAGAGLRLPNGRMASTSSMMASAGGMPAGPGVGAFMPDGSMSESMLADCFLNTGAGDSISNGDSLFGESALSESFLGESALLDNAYPSGDPRLAPNVGEFLFPSAGGTGPAPPPSMAGVDPQTGRRAAAPGPDPFAASSAAGSPVGRAPSMSSGAGGMPAGAPAHHAHQHGHAHAHHHHQPHGQPQPQPQPQPATGPSYSMGGAPGPGPTVYGGHPQRPASGPPQHHAHMHHHVSQSDAMYSSSPGRLSPHGPAGGDFPQAAGYHRSSSGNLYRPASAPNPQSPQQQQQQQQY